MASLAYVAGLNVRWITLTTYRGRELARGRYEESKVRIMGPSQHKYLRQRGTDLMATMSATFHANRVEMTNERSERSRQRSRE